MSERCPNCGHASGYWRRSSEDWRCRRCGYIWSDETGEPEGPAGGAGPAPEEWPAAPARVSGVTQVSGGGLLDEEIARILRERSAELAESLEEEEEGDRRLIILFSLGDEWYAVQVEQVREIRRQAVITPVPGTPDHISGVINLRGEIISVTELAKLLGLGERGEESALIVCELPAVTTALRVERVADIVDIAESAIEPPLATLERLRAEHVVGQVAVDDRLVTVLKLDEMITPVDT